MAEEHLPLSPYIPGTPEALDAVAAAPANHEVIFENDRVRTLRVIAAPDNHTVVLKNDKVRVLHVVIPPGVIEEKHTHARPSIFIINASPNMDYFNEKGEIVTRSGKLRDGEPFWVEPEGVHWLENHDTFAFDAIRIEVKT